MAMFLLSDKFDRFNSLAINRAISMAGELLLMIVSKYFLFQNDVFIKQANRAVVASQKRATIK